MIDLPPTDPGAEDAGAFLDSLLREALPEIKLALGELIDRENARSLPERYARLLPESVLVVTLRNDAAAVLAPLAETLERDLTDSVVRHGSLYDRSYRVQLRRSEDPDAPLYRVTAHAGHVADAEPGPADLDRSAAAAREVPRDPTPPSPQRAETVATEALPVADPDATRIDGAGPAGWAPGQWVLVVESLEGEEREVFRLVDPFTTVGRKSSDPELGTTIALSDVPHLSRRQLVLLFEERGGEPGFRVYNVGLNPVHAPDREIAGARVKRGSLDLDAVPDGSSHWVRPGVPLRIGDHGPVLRVDEVPPDPEEELGADPEATVHD